MNSSEILNIIKFKEQEIKKLQLEVDNLKKQYNQIITNSSEEKSSREDSVKVFMNYFKGRNDVYPYLSIDKNNSNIKYYIPACANEWKNGVCNKTMGKNVKLENHPALLVQGG